VRLLAALATLPIYVVRTTSTINAPDAMPTTYIESSANFCFCGAGGSGPGGAGGFGGGPGGGFGGDGGGFGGDGGGDGGGFGGDGGGDGGGFGGDGGGDGGDGGGPGGGFGGDGGGPGGGFGGDGGGPTGPKTTSMTEGLPSISSGLCPMPAKGLANVCCVDFILSIMNRSYKCILSTRSLP